MKTINLYSIRDVDMGNYAPPFLAISDTDAKQMVRDAIQPQSALHLYPASYHLYRVGAFDGDSGRITDTDTECICSVSDLVYRVARSVSAEQIGEEMEVADE